MKELLSSLDYLAKSKPILVNIKKLRPDAVMPNVKTLGSSGMDLALCGDSVTIYPGERLLLSTGIAIEIPFGHEGQVRSRSGMAAKNGLFVLNSPGTVDSDYRGEVKVIMLNTGKEKVSFKHGDRIAQLVIIKVPFVIAVEVEELSETIRGGKGFGSTGK